MGSEYGCKLVLIQRLGKVGDVEVGVTLIGERLELGVERFLKDGSAMSPVKAATARDDVLWQS